MFATAPLINYIVRVARHFHIERNSFHSLTPYCSKDSALSISSWDYSFATITLEDLQAHTSFPLILSSTAIEILTPSELESLLTEKLPRVRLQISLGAEFARHQELLTLLLERGCGLDILVDRPISAALQAFLANSCEKWDLRLCVLVNRYFSTLETLHSLPPATQQQTFLVMIPPVDADSHFCTADYALRLLKSLEGEWKILVFENAIDRLPKGLEKDFYSHFDLETFLKREHEASTYHSFREIFIWLVQRKWIFFLDFLHSVFLLLRHPTPAKFLHVFSVLFGPIKRAGHSFYIFLRYRSLTQIYSYFRYECLNKCYYSLRSLMAHFWIFVRHKLIGRVKTSASQIWIIFRYRLFIKIYFGAQSLLNKVVILLRYRLPSFLKKVGYPLLKVYWFTEHQFKKRILPFIKPEADE